MLQRYRAWSGALIVMAIAAVLLVLDLSDRSLQRYWSRHSFTSSFVSGLLVLLLTVLIVDRVTRIRQQRGQARAIGAQAAIIVAQAARAADAIGGATAAPKEREEASEELRTYTQMLLISAPLLIEAPLPRTFLETAQRAAVQLYRALREAADGRKDQDKARLDDTLAQLRAAAAPLLKALNREQRTAVGSDDVDARASYS